MGVRIASTQSTTIIASPAAAAETVICTAGPLNLIYDSAVVFLFWYCAVQVGTAGATLKFLIRRGATVNDPQVNLPSGTAAAAGTIVRYSGPYFDTPNGGAELMYSLTLTVAGATGASAITDVALMAVVL